MELEKELKTRNVNITEATETKAKINFKMNQAIRVWLL